MNSQLQRDVYKKAAELQFQESRNNEQSKDVGLYNDAHKKAIQEINSAEMNRNNSELRDIALDR